MDELAAAAAVVAIDVDPEDADIEMLDSTQRSHVSARCWFIDASL